MGICFIMDGHGHEHSMHVIMHKNIHHHKVVLCLRNCWLMGTSQATGRRTIDKKIWKKFSRIILQTIKGANINIIRPTANEKRERDENSQLSHASINFFLFPRTLHNFISLITQAFTVFLSKYCSIQDSVHSTAIYIFSRQILVCSLLTSWLWNQAPCRRRMLLKFGVNLYSISSKYECQREWEWTPLRNT